MTLTDTPVADLIRLPAGDAVTLLLDLTPEELCDVVRASLGREPDQAIWEVLTDPRVLGMTLAALKTMNLRVEAQLGDRKADLDQVHADWLAGEASKADWLAAKASHDEWRRRALGFRRLVQERLLVANARQKAIGVAQHAPNMAHGGKQARNSHNMDTLLDLATAVMAHKAAVTSGDGGPEDDEKLWEIFEQLTVQTRRDEMSLPRWVGYIEIARAEQDDDGDDDG